MKTLKLFGMALIAILMCVNFTSCSNEDVVETQKSQKVTVSLGCVGEILDITHEPLSRAETPNLYTIIVYEGDYRYASGSFASKDNITIDLFQDKTYKFEVYYRYYSGTQSPTNQFTYELQSVTDVLPLLDFKKDDDYYYGLTEGYVPSLNESVEIYMKRMVFGLNVKAEGLSEGASLNVKFKSNEFSLTSASNEFDNIFSFQAGGARLLMENIYKGVYVDDEYVNYFSTISMKITLTRVDGIEENLGSHDIRIERNKKTYITIKVGNKDMATSNGFEIEIENDDMGDGNQYEFDVEEGTIIDTTINPTE